MRIVVLEACMLWSLILGQARTAWGKPELQNESQKNAQGVQSSQPCGAVADADRLKMEIALAGPSATRISIMPARYAFLQQTLKGLQKTGIHLIADYGSGFAPAEHGDDAGLFYFVPWLANSLGLNLDDAIDLFLGSIVVIAFLAGTAGLFLFLKSWLSRVIALVGIFLVSVVSIKSGDIYIMQSSVVLGLVPWFLYFSRKRNFNWILIGFAFFAGFCAAIANVIRNHSGTAVLVWASCVFAFYLTCSPTRKLFLISGMIVGCLMPALWFHGLLARRNNYLMQHSSSSFQLSGKHVFWHTVYIGFGFLGNDVVPAYRDEVAAEKVQSISPQVHYFSSQYEDILRREVITLVKNNKRFVARTLAAKLKVIGVTILVSANIGLIASIKYPKPWPLDLAFWGAISFSSLPAILAVPHRPYMLGLIAFGFLYGIVSVQNAIDHGILQPVKNESSLSCAG